MEMVGSVLKLTRRTIRSFFGRYMALLLIVALGAGFFAGLKITTDAMVNTGDLYLAEQNLYDFRLYSTLGFTEEDVDSFAALPGVAAAEGTVSVDALINYEDGEHSVKLMAVTEQVNLPSLEAGRMPSAEGECLADAKLFDEDDIGQVIYLAEENSESVSDALTGDAFTIVGIAHSPLYLGLDRGTTNIGSGSLYAFLYLFPDSFTSEVFTEVNVTLTETAEIYSDEYDELIEAYKGTVTDECARLADARYETLLADNGLTDEMAQMLGFDGLTELAESFGIHEPETYVLTREENAGYVSFENDTAILSGIANIFPVFFILIAMLVCITTITRMVDEERTQIGVLKAMGYSSGAITAKYLLYAGSATVIGWAVGFFACTWGLPKIFWFAYNALYDFAPLAYLFSPALAGLTLAASLVGILGSAWLSCRKELSSVPAQLIRPRAAKNGKRILLEHLTILWNRLSFLQKITLRNMFRYKKRFIMMLVGIGCCAGLVVTAFGVRDSMIDVGTVQFETIQMYDLEVTFEAGEENTAREVLDDLEEVEAYLPANIDRVDLLGKANMNSISMMSFADTDSLSGFWDFHSGEEEIPFPERGEVLVSAKIAEKLGLSEGETLEIRNTDMQTCTLTVSGIFENYIYNFVILSAETFTDAFGTWQANSALVRINGDSEEMAGLLTDSGEFTGVSQLTTTKHNVDSALSCLDYIIWMVVLFSGALAFIVIFNLTNINLAERSREIATVQVLGFYPNETGSYVLRENLVLSVLASIIGLPLGTLFHRAVMSMIVIDMFTFQVKIRPVSYVLALICTVIFAVIVNLVMKRQINKIQMVESLKTVE